MMNMETGLLSQTNDFIFNGNTHLFIKDVSSQKLNRYLTKIKLRYESINYKTKREHY